MWPGVPYILAACTAVSILSTDLITPSIPDFPQAFDTSIRLAQMSVSVNLAAYAFAQLIHGPLADTLGRKRLLIGAMLCFAAVSGVTALSGSMEQLLAGRFFQGIFSSVPSVVIVLLIRELYRPTDALGIMTLYGGVLGLAPALGPLIGGYLHVWYGWQAGFVFVALLALAVAGMVWRFVPESLGDRKALRAQGIVTDYLGLMGNGAYIRGVVATSLTFGAFYAYVTTAPVVFIDLIGIPPQRYGQTNVVIVSAFIAGNLIAARLRNRYEAGQILRAGMLGACAAMALLLAPVMMWEVSVPMILAPMSLYAVSLAFVLAAGPMVVLNFATDHPAGPAASLLGSLQLALSALAGYLSARFFDDTALPMVLVMGGFVLVGAVLLPRRLSPPAAPVSDPVG